MDIIVDTKFDENQKWLKLEAQTNTWRFPRMGYTPIAGWLIEKLPSRNGFKFGEPDFGKPSNAMIFLHQVGIPVVLRLGASPVPLGQPQRSGLRGTLEPTARERRLSHA